MPPLRLFSSKSKRKNLPTSVRNTHSICYQRKGEDVNLHNVGNGISLELSSHPFNEFNLWMAP